MFIALLDVCGYLAALLAPTAHSAALSAALLSTLPAGLGACINQEKRNKRIFDMNRMRKEQFDVGVRCARKQTSNEAFAASRTLLSGFAAHLVQRLWGQTAALITMSFVLLHAWLFSLFVLDGARGTDTADFGIQIGPLWPERLLFVLQQTGMENGLQIRGHNVLQRMWLVQHIK
jgi:hypothetical protein